jgi:hypothetical protein
VAVALSAQAAARDAVRAVVVGQGDKDDAPLEADPDEEEGAMVGREAEEGLEELDGERRGQVAVCEL